METKLNLETCTFEEVKSAGLDKNMFVSPVAYENFVYGAATKIYHDIHAANRDVDGFEDALTYENIEKLIEDIANEIFDNFWDVEDDEFPPACDEDEE